MIKSSLEWEAFEGALTFYFFNCSGILLPSGRDTTYSSPPYLIGCWETKGRESSYLWIRTRKATSFYEESTFNQLFITNSAIVGLLPSMKQEAKIARNARVSVLARGKPPFKIFYEALHGVPAPVPPTRCYLIMLPSPGLRTVSSTAIVCTLHLIWTTPKSCPLDIVQMAGAVLT